MGIVEQRSGAWSPELSLEEQATVLAIADATLDGCVRETAEAFSFEPYVLTKKLKVVTATFVTLKQDGMLRGCIGSLEPVVPLYRSVHDNAFNAARRDPRFRPVTARERAHLDVQVSILSPMRPIASPDAFRAGEHGVVMELAGRRAVFLPEVAPEQGWSREETLQALSLKAGLPPDAWREGATFKVFSSVALARE